jgi:hypothetical protein
MCRVVVNEWPDSQYFTSLVRLPIFFGNGSQIVGTFSISEIKRKKGKGGEDSKLNNQQQNNY